MRSIRYFVVPLIVIVAVIAGIVIGLQIDDDSMFGSYKTNVFNDKTYDTGFVKTDVLYKLFNNNPIDRCYEKKLDLADTPMDQADVIGAWIEAYENEIESAYLKLNEILDENASDENLNEVEEAKNSLGTMKKSYEAYSDDYSNFSFDYRMAILGYGTGIHADSGFMTLRKARQTLFELAELIYSYTGDFYFQFDEKG